MSKVDVKSKLMGDLRMVYSLSSEVVARCMEKEFQLNKFVQALEAMEEVVHDCQSKVDELKKKHPECFYTERDFFPGSDKKKPDKNIKKQVDQLVTAENRRKEQQLEQIEKYESNKLDLVHSLQIEMVGQAMVFTTEIGEKILEIDTKAFNKMAFAFRNFFSSAEKTLGKGVLDHEEIKAALDFIDRKLPKPKKNAKTSKKS